MCRPDAPYPGRLTHAYDHWYRLLNNQNGSPERCPHACSGGGLADSIAERYDAKERARGTWPPNGIDQAIPRLSHSSLPKTSQAATARKRTPRIQRRTDQPISGPRKPATKRPRRSPVSLPPPDWALLFAKSRPSARPALPRAFRLQRIRNGSDASLTTLQRCAIHDL